jgi:hypothetical protein
MHYLSKGKPMKLDALTPDELECYEEWNSADEYGGDCSTQGYAWAAWQNERIIIVEDDQGFVEAHTYTVAEANLNSLSVGTYFARVESLRAADAAFYAQEQEDEERDAMFSGVSDSLDEAKQELADHIRDHNSCPGCVASMVTYGSIGPTLVHEHGCPTKGKIDSLRTQLERMEDY